MSSPGRHPSGRRCGDPFTLALIVLAMPYALLRLAIDTRREIRAGHNDPPNPKSPPPNQPPGRPIVTPPPKKTIPPPKRK